MSLNKNDIDINTAIALCVENKIFVKSIKCGKRYMIKVDFNGTEISYKDKLVYKSALHSCISKTWRYFAANIINDNNAKKKK
jgi:hypothetical protein